MLRLGGLRRVLDRVWQLITGATSAANGATRDERNPLNVSIDVGTVKSDGRDPIPIEVTVPAGEIPEQVDFTSETRIGLEEAFHAEGEHVRIVDGFRPGVAAPSRVMDFENPHQHGKLMHVSPRELVLPLEPGEVTLGVGVFPHEDTREGPIRYWDTASVGLSVEDPPANLHVRCLSGSPEGGHAVEVYRPSPFDPSEVRLGPRTAFDHVESDHSHRIRIADGSADTLPLPIRSVAVAGHENHWLLRFPAFDADVFGPDAWAGELAVAIFPEGDETAIPATDWAVARVADAPELDTTG